MRCLVSMEPDDESFDFVSSSAEFGDFPSDSEPFMRALMPDERNASVAGQCCY